jgi:hypothetical protein
VVIRRFFQMMTGGRQQSDFGLLVSVCAPTSLGLCSPAPARNSQQEKQGGTVKETHVGNRTAAGSPHMGRNYVKSSKRPKEQREEQCRSSLANNLGRRAVFPFLSPWFTFLKVRPVLPARYSPSTRESSVGLLMSQKVRAGKKVETMIY